MKIYLGNTGTLRHIELVKNTPHLGICYLANAWRYPKDGVDWFLDNGAYSCWVNSLPFNSYNQHYANTYQISTFLTSLFFSVSTHDLIQSFGTPADSPWMHDVTVRGNVLEPEHMSSLVPQS